MSITIYHNPKCSKSRETLAIIESHGVSPTIIEYLKSPPSADTIASLASRLDVPVSALLRDGETVVKDANDLPAKDDDKALADWIARHPQSLQRPIVVNTESGAAVIGRPPENVTSLLDK